jgi:hypothetical protein
MRLTLSDLFLTCKYWLSHFRIIYRPRKYPDFFNVYYDDLANESAVQSFNIYEIKFTGVVSEYERIYGKLTKKEEKLARNDMNIPVIIVNPSFEQNESVHIDHINIGMRIKV